MKKYKTHTSCLWRDSTITLVDVDIETKSYVLVDGDNVAKQSFCQNYHDMFAYAYTYSIDNANGAITLSQCFDS